MVFLNVIIHRIFCVLSRLKIFLKKKHGTKHAKSWDRFYSFLAQDNNNYYIRFFPIFFESHFFLSEQA